MSEHDRQNNWITRNLIEAQDTEKYKKRLNFYRRMGVEVYKNYTPLTGDFVSKKLWHRLGHRQVDSSKESLAKMIACTYTLELAHGTFFVGAGIVGLMGLSEGNTVLGATALLANIPVNFYPVFLQRYNRLRLFHALGRKMGIDK